MVIARNRNMSALNFLQTEAFDCADTHIRHKPFSFMTASRLLSDSARAVLAADFPHYPGAGFFPHEPADCGPSINRLIEELTTPALADAVGTRLGIESLGQYPTLVTICRALNRRHGTIHTDSRSKIVTALVYLNESWPDTSGGCLRFLNRADSIEDMVCPELRPIYGNFAAFRRSETSFHGHLPYAGERRVIQIAWLTSEDEKLRKTRRGKLSRLFKKLFGNIDRRIGAGRKDDASHLD